MSVTNAPTSLQAILCQIESPAPAPGAARAASAAKAGPAPSGPERMAAAEPRVQVPKDAATLNPNAPRGTYVNLVV